ncbi:MAG: pentapeptide repeat-containing protein [Ardenticatenaceae bacterium]|nr:pentapeptide repeat-containing protein [Ardenticatenaceae bacterium]
MSLNQTRYRRNLRRLLGRSFNLSDVRMMAFDLAVNWDDLRGETLPEKAQALIEFLALRGRLQELVDLGREERPDLDWPEIPPAAQQIEDEENQLSAGERDQAVNAYLNDIARFTGITDPTSIALVQALTDQVWRFLDPPRQMTVFNLLRKADLLNRLDHHQRVFQDLELVSKDLRGLQLAGAIVTGTKLLSCNLSGANLEQVNLDGCNLMMCNLSRARLKGASLRKTLLSSADFTAADLSYARLNEAGVMGARFINAHLKGARLYRAVVGSADFSGADLSGVDLREASLRWANLSRAKFEETKLARATYNQHTRWPEGFNPADHDLVYDHDHIEL